MSLAIIILAAGKGTRMKSDLAKVLHPLCGKPLIAWALDTVAPLAPDRTIVVVGHQAEAVESTVNERFANIEFALQSEMLGTGDAARRAVPMLEGFVGDVIVTYGDVPLLETETLRRLMQTRRDNESAASMLVAQVDDPGAYGRVLCDEENRVLQIVEAKDATPEILAVANVNAGT
jgi:bifunctional N-acetylglucosamine-1-phosphate-uridyltransferase/glucosamine-1-phosphate-acetyltransferase GlmU-like protein